MLATLQRTGSLGAAGWAEAACIVGMALGTPATGRLVDRFGTAVVLRTTGVAHVVVLAFLAAATLGWLPGRAALFPALAAAAGATVPPAGPVIRTAWNDLVPAEDLPRVNALESTLSHAFHVVVAGVVAAATWLGQLGYVFAACALLNAAGVTLLLQCAGAVHLPRREHPAPLTAVFRQPGTLRVLVAVFGWALTLGPGVRRHRLVRRRGPGQPRGRAQRRDRDRRGDRLGGPRGPARRPLEPHLEVDLDARLGRLAGAAGPGRPAAHGAVAHHGRRRARPAAVRRRVHRPDRRDHPGRDRRPAHRDLLLADDDLVAR